MSKNLSKIAKQQKIKYFLISFVDFFGVLRSKLVPARAIDEMQENGAGFAGFATWLDMTPADSDMFAIPDPDSLIQLPWNKEIGWLASDLYREDYEKLGTEPGFCHHCHTGRCPVGVATQDPKLEERLDPVEGGRRLRNYLSTLTLELQTLARANGKSDVRNLEPEDLVALTVEAAAMARVPLAGTDWIPGLKEKG